MRKPIYPDFLWKRDSSKRGGQSWDVVLDAKYKRTFTERDGRPRFNVAREDRYQMISYLHLTKAQRGVFVCPMLHNIKDNGLENEQSDQSDDDILIKSWLHNGGFSRSHNMVLSLPDDADASTLETKYDEVDGVLNLTVSKLIRKNPTFTYCREK